MLARAVGLVDFVHPLGFFVGGAAHHEDVDQSVLTDTLKRKTKAMNPESQKIRNSKTLNSNALLLLGITFGIRIVGRFERA